MRTDHSPFRKEGGLAETFLNKRQRARETVHVFNFDCRMRLPRLKGGGGGEWVQPPAMRCAKQFSFFLPAFFCAHSSHLHGLHLIADFNKRGRCEGRKRVGGRGATDTREEGGLLCYTLCWGRMERLHFGESLPFAGVFQSSVFFSMRESSVLSS